jgi:phosphoribosylformylglycinamidine cyclo-ligase
VAIPFSPPLEQFVLSRRMMRAGWAIMAGMSATPDDELSYAAAGVDLDRARAGLRGLLGWVNRTREFRSGVGGSALPIGYFANVVDLGRGQGLAISTDGVGTKILVAQLVDRYDTVGIDCVAMNVNDVLCVGAEPLSLVDYLAVEDPQPRLLEEIGKGLYEGARRANVTIVGGELAQVPAMLRGERAGFGFDLTATCVGLVPLDRIVHGGALEPGDVLLGLPSSGIHSNGLTLAREVLLGPGGYAVESHMPELGRTLGEELLEPTAIYVREVLEVQRAGIEVRAMAHITGDGLLNLARVRAPLGYLLDNLPEPPPIFQLIRRLGDLADDEMYRVFNMGIGFCLAVPPQQAEAALGLLRGHYPGAMRLGYAVADPDRKIVLEPLGVTLGIGG